MVAPGAAALHMGARDLPRSIVEAIFREALPMVQGASIIDDWIAEGEAKGRAEGKAEGKAEGQLEEARRLLTRLLQARFGDLPPDLSAQLSTADTVYCEELLVRAALVESLQELGW